MAQCPSSMKFAFYFCEQTRFFLECRIYVLHNAHLLLRGWQRKLHIANVVQVQAWFPRTVGRLVKLATTVSL